MPENIVRLKITKDDDGTQRLVGPLKDAAFADEGRVRAVFATLGVVDHQGDMMLPGSIGDQKVRLSTWGHGSWQGGLNGLPVGKGRIYESGESAVFEGQFFLTTNAGREVYETVKALGDLQEWSFALPEIESESRSVNGQTVRAIKRVRVPEVSPVLLGAGIGTRTLDVKDLTNAPADLVELLRRELAALDAAQGKGSDAQTPKDMKLIDHLEWLLAQSAEVAERVKSVADLRERQDRGPSRESMKRVGVVAAALKGVARVLEDIRAKHDGIVREYLRFQQQLTGRR